jgi:fructose-1,6-bisphosphatase/inositol monophosphatase family enzyme
VTDWLAVCRASVEDVRGVLEDLPTRVEREPVVGEGLGGDETTAVDKAAEDAILARLRDLDVTIVSEEAGRVE